MSGDDAEPQFRMPGGNFKDILSRWNKKAASEEANASRNKCHIAGHAYRKNGAATLKKSIRSAREQSSTDLFKEGSSHEWRGRRQCPENSSGENDSSSPTVGASSRKTANNKEEEDSSSPDLLKTGSSHEWTGRRPLPSDASNTSDPPPAATPPTAKSTPSSPTTMPAVMEEKTTAGEESNVSSSPSSSTRKNALASRIGVFNKATAPPFVVKKTKSPGTTTMPTTTVTTAEEGCPSSPTKSTEDTLVVAKGPSSPAAKKRWTTLKAVGIAARATIRIAHRMPKNIYQKPLRTQSDFVPPEFEHSQEEIDIIKKALKKNFVFSDLQDHELIPLMGAFEKCHFKAKENIITQGDKGDFFYIIYEGKVVFDVNGNVVGKAGKGNSFGELALLYTCPRAASVNAHKDATLFRVDQATFRFILQNQTKKSEQEKKNLLRGVDFFADVNAYDLKRLAKVMTPLVFTPKDVLVKKGETGDRMFILQEGEVMVQDISVGSTKYADHKLGPGAYFGERALQTSEPRAANIVALTYGVAFTIDRGPFQKVLGNISKLVSKSQDTRMLAGVPLFDEAQLTGKQFDAMAQVLVETCFRSGAKVFKKDDLATPAIYFVREGAVKVEKPGKKGFTTISPGGFFGEEIVRMGAKHHLSSVPSPVTVTCTKKTTLAELRLAKCRSIFDVEILAGRSSEAFSLGEIMDDDDDEEEDAFVKHIKAKHELDVEFRPPVRPKVELSDLEKIKMLGAGTFGQVWLVTDKSKKKKDEQTVYALKVQTKYDLVQEGQVDAVIAERNIMSKIFHPFIVDFIASFQDDRFIFMVIHLIQGGELFSRVHDETASKDGLPDYQAKFYALCVADALAYLHRLGYVYRDLKTENVMIDIHGYPKLIDFGFAKHITEKTFTLCGTPGYLPPEIVMTRGHDWSADHWSLGILIYYMITGKNPFYYEGMDQMSLFQSIVEDDYQDPKEASQDAKDLIAGLLEKEPLQRLGSLSGGEQDVLDHPWFRDLDLGDMRTRKATAPWVPKVKDPLDTNCFDDWDHLVDKMVEDLPELEPKQAALFKAF